MLSVFTDKVIWRFISYFSFLQRARAIEDSNSVRVFGNIKHEAEVYVDLLQAYTSCIYSQLLRVGIIWNQEPLIRLRTFSAVISSIFPSDSWHFR